MVIGYKKESVVGCWWFGEHADSFKKHVSTIFTSKQVGSEVNAAVCFNLDEFHASELKNLKYSRNLLVLLYPNTGNRRQQ